MPRRPLVPAATAAALLLTLSGCERPTPGVTFASGSRSVHVESTKFCFEEPDKDCVTNAGIDRIGVLRVTAGETVTIDVDGELADDGWYVVDTDAQSRTSTFDSSHFSFTADFTNRPTAGVINLQVKSTVEKKDDAAVRGFWRFQLVQEG